MPKFFLQMTTMVDHKLRALIVICRKRLPLVYFLKLGHDWSFVVFDLITAPDWTQLNSTSRRRF